MKRIWKRSLVAAVVLASGIQVLPIGHARSNPPTTMEIAWDSPGTRTLFFRACGDCHSNETQWPWYSRVAPVSWLLADHVRHGRGELNVSEWSAERFGEEASESAETVRDRSMPPSNYLLMHPEARLSDAETAAFINGLEATFGSHSEYEDD